MISAVSQEHSRIPEDFSGWEPEEIFVLYNQLVEKRFKLEENSTEYKLLSDDIQTLETILTTIGFDFAD